MKAFAQWLAVAMVAAGLSSSAWADRGITIRGQMEQQAGVKVGAYRALVIGIDDYVDPNIPDLQTASADARAVAELLKKSYGFTDVTLLLDRLADGSSIQKQLRRLATTSRPDDSVLIYYAGHGDLDRVTGDGWWIPASATAGDSFTYMDNAVIQKFLKAIPARHVLLVSDSCFSGTLFGASRAMPEVIDDKYYAAMFKERSRWGMTSGNLTPVADGSSGGHSLFAGQFIKALQGNLQPFVTPREIYQRIAAVISNNSDQVPQANPIRNVDDEGGAFVFIRSDGVTAASRPFPAGTADSGGNAMELAFWNAIKDSADPAQFRAYLDQFPNGTFVTLARLKAGSAPHVEPARTTFGLTIAATPSDARIRILNIGPAYQPGIQLEPGRYHIEASRAGYSTHTEWVELGRSDMTHGIALDQRGIELPEMVVIPAGSFTMGSNDVDDEEKPVHTVQIRRFKMMTTEVTQALWEAVMGSNPSSFKGADRPVEKVSWDDIQIFIRKLNQHSGQHFRLPSEAEWEYAARAGTTTRWSWGNSDSVAGQYAWYDGNSGDQTHPVGQKSPNGFGLYDMHGNVWEWVEDRYHDNYNGAPGDGSAWTSGSSLSRVLRGGSWYNLPNNLRSANRFRDNPDFRSTNYGLRLAQDF